MDASREDTSTLTFMPLRLRHAHSMAGWRYEGAYAFYDFGQVVPRMLALFQPLLGFVGAGYYAAEHSTGELIGVFSFHKQGSTVTIGLGMRPDLTGQGAGLSFVRAGLAFGRQQYMPELFRLTVATFNSRAIRVYQRAGFVAGRRFIQQARGRPHEFLEMIRSAADPI